MSFPQTDDVIAAMQASAAAVAAGAKLLRQYQALGQTQEASIEQMRQSLAERDVLTAKVAEMAEENRQLREQLAQMRDHPDVKAERLRVAREEASRLAAEIRQLETDPES